MPKTLSWLPELSRDGAPLYLAVADALAADVGSGRLPGGTRLPSQRALADALGVDFTTISRAYNEARDRGLIEGRPGQGTFVRGAVAAARRASPGGGVDMSMNLPPLFDDAAVASRMWREIGAIEQDGGLPLLLRYQEAGGSAADRAAGANWLAGRIGTVDPARVLVAAGAQGALSAILGTIAAPGDAICVEQLTYPGMRALAAFSGVRLLPVAMDEHGLVPEALEDICRADKPKALYCMPTIHNPTTITMPPARREALVEVARRHGLPIIEDDAYGMLPTDGAPTLARLAPELTYYIGGIAKTLSPALRIAYLVAPDLRAALRLTGGIRATTLMASPLSTAIATRWIQGGTAQAVLHAIRTAAAERRRVTRNLLPQALLDDAGFHAWLPLPGRWQRGPFVAGLRNAGIGVVPSDAFAVGEPVEAVRLGLGSAPTLGDLEQSLAIIADLLEQPAGLANMVI
ncbi:GntR family transcriptional regulator [Devosia sp. 17-2-E-8]|nr:GntR family transcriptional regulator [Devosia sp. 17-2-E-8]